tara:strand:- start:713 stop:1039 length:327 start_codon:yes stop_codon:yes gene_type:complete
VRHCSPHTLTRLAHLANAHAGYGGHGRASYALPSEPPRPSKLSFEWAARTSEAKAKACAADGWWRSADVVMFGGSCAHEMGRRPGGPDWQAATALQVVRARVRACVRA